METNMTNKDIGFYGGLLTALIVVHSFDEPVIVDDIMNTLGNKSQSEFIQFVKDNEEYELSGLEKWEEQKESETK